MRRRPADGVAAGRRRVCPQGAGSGTEPAAAAAVGTASTVVPACLPAGARAGTVLSEGGWGRNRSAGRTMRPAAGAAARASRTGRALSSRLAGRKTGCGMRGRVRRSRVPVSRHRGASAGGSEPRRFSREGRTGTARSRRRRQSRAARFGNGGGQIAARRGGVQQRPVKFPVVKGKMGVGRGENLRSSGGAAQRALARLPIVFAGRDVKAAGAQT